MITAATILAIVELEEVLGEEVEEEGLHTSLGEADKEEVVGGGDGRQCLDGGWEGTVSNSACWKFSL